MKPPPRQRWTRSPTVAAALPGHREALGSHWAEFPPFLAFPPDVRRVIYTTNLIESMNARLRKVTRNRGQFPTEQAALKVLYLAVGNLDEYRGATVRTGSSGWKKRCKRSRSTSRDESPHHDRHDHLQDGLTLPRVPRVAVGQR